jgi:hypothetical protein
MELKTRRIFFYSLILIFTLVGAYLIASAQGWVLDIANFRIVKTGSIFLKYSPSDAMIEINGKAADFSHGLLTNGALISRLTPGEYEIKISETGYRPWEKKMTVSETLVTSATQIKLWPEDWAAKEVTTSSLSNFWLTGAGAVLQTKDKTLHLDGYALRGRQTILSAQNSSYLITSDGTNYFFTDLNNPEISTNLSVLFASLTENASSSVPAETPAKFFFHPFSEGKIIIIAENSVYSLDTKRISLSKLLSAKKIIASAMSDNEVFIENAKGNLFSYNLFLQTSGAYEAIFPTDTSIKASPNGSLIFFLRKNGELLEYDRASKITEKLSGSAADFFISPDGKILILVSKDGKLSALAISDFYADGNVKTGDGWTIPSRKEMINDFKWLPDSPNYGLVLSGNELFITELGNHAPQNTYPVTDGVKKFFVQNGNIYVLKTDGTLQEINSK